MRRHTMILLFCSGLLSACDGVEPQTTPLATSHSGEVTIKRDARGVAYVRGASASAMYFGWGYVHATDRLFHMHARRLQAQGRLSEFFGAGHLETDKAARLFGLARRARKIYDRLDQDTQKALLAYAAGVNRAVQIIRDSKGLPEPFGTHGISQIPRWQPWDCVMVWDTILFSYHKAGGELAQEDKFQSLVEAIGFEAALEQFTNVSLDDSGAVMPEPPQHAFRIKSLPRWDTQNAVEPTVLASHAVAVSGRRSKSGYPLLLGMPQIRLSDAIFHEINVEGGGIKAHGISFPGAPGLLEGYTPINAWVVTAMGSDTLDLFRLARRGNAYLLDGAERPFVTRTEKILVKGDEPVTLTVEQSYFGPVIDEVLAPERTNESTSYAALHLNSFEYPGVHAQAAALQMLRAKSWPEFREAMAGYANPSLHFVYADTNGPEGTLAYAPGAVMIQRASHGTLPGVIPQDGTRSDSMWKGFFRPPTMSNPDSGVIVSANNSPHGSWYKHYGIAGPGDSLRSYYLRNAVFDALEKGQGRVSAAELGKIYNHCIDPFRVKLLEIANELLQRGAQFSPNAMQAITVLNQWDGTLLKTAPGIALAEKISLFNPYLATSLVAVYGGREASIARLLKDYAADPERVLTLFAGPLQQWANTTFRQAWVAAEMQYGSDPETWDGQVDRKGVVEFNKNMIFPGSLMPEHDISLNYTCQSLATMWSQAGNIYTQLVDLSDPNRSMANSAPGVSQDPASPYFDNQVPLWETGKMAPAPLELVGGGPGETLTF